MTRNEYIVMAMKDEVRRRKCPKCDQSLVDASVGVTLKGNIIRLDFMCPWCNYSSGGETPMTAEIQREAMTYYYRTAEPITPEEVLDAALAIRAWKGDLRALVAAV